MCSPRLGSLLGHRFQGHGDMDCAMELDGNMDSVMELDGDMASGRSFHKRDVGKSVR